MRKTRARRYSTIFRGKFAVCPDRIENLKDLADAFRGVADHLQKQADDGLALDTQGGEDDYWFIFTGDATLAKKHGLTLDDDE